ncbi:SpoIIE family protein phosphatase [Nocardioides sp.]|uniref:PP2C family protein-serine/threonine phosphatase n=1 Tax=Nocardioides sp. TaxID=35761 RepID=UPI00286D4471|nr:SpoIIE family protein phosphatase [Nocardioides sp.]
MNDNDAARRERALASLGLAETMGSARLNRITDLVTQALGLPISTVTVLDGDRASFPASTGTDGEDMAVSDTFCEVTQALGATVVVEDARLDDRFSEKRAVQEDGIRFYVGQPLRDVHGTVVASLCMADMETRTLRDEELALFLELASWAEQELVGAAEMRLAGEAQSALLPPGPVSHGVWRIEGNCVPASAIGGDFYDYDISTHVASVRLGDVMGKGTAAALIGAGVRACLRGTNDAINAGVDLGVTVTRAARVMEPDLERTSAFSTLFEAAVDLEDGTLRYVDAGSGLALLVRSEGEVVHLLGQDRPLGILPGDHWTEHRDEVRPGDRLVVFSDGLLDLVGDSPGWVDRVSALVRKYDDPADLIAEVSEQSRLLSTIDDVTIVVLSCATGE